MAKTLKDFLNERQLGPMVVKNPDEQKFIDKHVVAKTDDRNGNDDELFKGSKVKMADRPKHRKGYNPGEDEEVYEELKGNQHKIDANKNGKVDAHDFHLLRKKKKVAEEAEELEELSTDTLRNYRAKAKDDAYDAADVDDDRRLRKRSMGSWDAGKKILKRGDALRKEEVEQIDELDHKLGGTLSRYINKTKDNPKREEGRNLALKKRWGDAKYGTSEPKVKAAVREEAEQIDELSKSTMGAYTKKAAADFTARKPKMGYDGQLKKMQNRTVGVNRALDKMYGEEAEQIDEISAEKKDAYAQKAGKQLPGLFAKSNSADGARKYYNRKNAVRKIANEGSSKQHIEVTHAVTGQKKKVPVHPDNAFKALNHYKSLSSTKSARIVSEDAEQVDEKLNMDKASMGTVIKDFQKSDAPQFQGKSQKKRQVMAIAAKLSAERGGKPLNKEERLLAKLADISETHKRTMVSVFEKLNEDNQREFMLACDTAEGIEQMLDFSIQHRGE